MKPRVLCMTDLSVAPEARSHLQEVCDLDERPSNRSQLLELIADYDAFWGHTELKLDSDFFSRANKLQAIATASTGRDHIDLDAAEASGVRVLSITRDYGLLDTFTATAECAWMLLLACHRHLRTVTREALIGDWHGNQRIGSQLSGRTLGVLGVGRLGQMTTTFGNAFRMRVIGCDLEPIEQDWVESVDFYRLLEESDVICIHVHMTKDNFHLFDSAVLARMKPGSILVNTSRGDIVDEAALINALETGNLSAYGADVVHDEWREHMEESPLIRYANDHENVIITPHIGGSTSFSLTNARVFTAKKLAHFLINGEELRMP